MTPGHTDRPAGQLVELDGPGVTVADVVAVARHRVPVELTDAAIERMAAARAVVERLAAGTDAVYGLSTGFGALATLTIPPERRRDLQRALVRSHAAGMGPAVEDEVVRAMMFLRARTLALGFSGARPEVAGAMVAAVNAGVVPRGARVRLARRVRRPGSTRPRRLGADGRGARRRSTASASTPRPRSNGPVSLRSNWSRRRGSRSPTAPTASWACCASPSTTRPRCSPTPISRPRSPSKACSPPTGRSPTTCSRSGHTPARP